MCGIAGIVSADPGNIGVERLEKMGNELSHRGPDGKQCWTSDSKICGFAHCRLSIIDLGPTGNQPMHYSGRNDNIGKYTIVHNGEIYNYIELREELKKNGYIFRTETDTEVILAAFDQWKETCLDHFDGMFSFAIWNEESKELFAARDRFGEKPFFYCLEGRCFLFGSEMKAIWAAGISREPNRNMLFNFITIGYTDNPNSPAETFFENILKLPAASYLTFSPLEQKLQVIKYWDIDPEFQDKKITDEEAKEKLLGLLKDSVKKRLRSDVPLGTSLSGGIDSSSIAAIGHSFKHEQLSYKCFTAGFPGYEKDETEFAKVTARHLGLQPSVTSVTVENFLEDWNRFSRHQEEPVGSASAYAQFRMYALAKKENVKVLLDGQGADELLGGYPKYYKWYWQELFHKRKLIRSKEIQLAHLLGVKEKFGLKNIMASLFPDIASVILERQYLLKALRQEDLDREFVRLQSHKAYYDLPEIRGLNGILYFNCFEHGLEELLRYADRNAMAHGREVRLPYLDHSLVEFVFSLPSHFKIRQGWTKWLLRETMNERLPREICWRKVKVGFEPPQQQWMQHEKVREMIRAAKKKLVDEKILKSSVIDKPIIPLGAHKADNYDWRYLSSATLFS